jgi:phosphoglycolate phosphatase-like HAD superfamily hydrolase
MALELATLPLGGPRKALGQWRALQAYRRAQEDLRWARNAGRARSQTAAAAAASGLPVAEVERLAAEWMARRPLKYLTWCRARGLDRLLDALDGRGIRALGLEGRFWPVLSASDPEIAAFKPSPRGYLRACELWNVPAAEVLVVGDRVEVDAAGAAAAGMRSAIVSRRRRLALPAGCMVVPSLERLARVVHDY